MDCRDKIKGKMESVPSFFLGKSRCRKMRPAVLSGRSTCFMYIGWYETEGSMERNGNKMDEGLSVSL